MALSIREKIIVLRRYLLNIIFFLLVIRAFRLKYVTQIFNINNLKILIFLQAYYDTLNTLQTDSN